MNKLLTAILSLIFIINASAQQSPFTDSKYFEMRVYTAHEGKMPDLIKRFENHTTKLFERAGMENVGYFLPVDKSDNKLTYILGYPNENARERMWQSFLNDPEWKKVYEDSRKNGPLVKSIEETYMVLAPGLNDLPKPSASGIFQLRTYHCFDGKIENIQARFRDHTRALFEKQGLKNYPYFLTVEKDGSQSKLVYLLGHENQSEFEEAFQRFANDPEWIQVRDASEESGKIVERVDAKFFTALPFSKMK
ncbi:NIPSNAP family protein [Algoriphagus hitonicola]|uniref:NIPSNAP protein n=1 Tax=Algoriphagus hitonicola TaxID=435880 RepID=A0A1I2X0A0_9BACT|nr:NIPSNAP family protein [Algoriphagus hitonicola]SFH06945.1 NIPSNAP protein [Algoriphagus hitonicola]